MKNRIEQEIDLTLNCLNESDAVQVSDLFVDAVSSKISGLHTCRGITYRSRAFYPVMIVLLVVMNIAVLTGSFKKQGTAGGQYDQSSIMAAEYGIGQTSYSAF